MRLLRVAASSDSPEAYIATSTKLVEEMGNPITYKPNAIVHAEPNALDKLRGLQEGG